MPSRARANTTEKMRQYERYVFSHLLWPAVVITVSLTAIVWLTQVLRFLDFILNRGLSLADFLYLTGLMLPSLLLILMPISLTMAVLYTYNKLTAESELVVLNAVGISKWQLAKPALILGGVALMLCYALAFYIMPLSNHRFRDIRTLFRDKYASVLLEEQVFNSPMSGLTVFVRERDGANNLNGILLHDSRDTAQTVTMIAERGRVEQTGSGPKFYLEHGIRQQRKDGRVSWLKFDQYALEVAFYGQSGARKLSPEEQTIVGLYQREGLDAKQQRAYRAEANQRLTWPLLAVVLPLVGIAMLFSSEFNRRGQSKRVIAAAITITALVLSYFMLRNVTVKFGDLAILLYVLVIGAGLVSVYILISGRVVTLPRLQRGRA